MGGGVVITVIDRAIMENASGMRPLGESLRAGAWEVVRGPGGFLGGRPFGLIFVRARSGAGGGGGGRGDWDWGGEANGWGG